MSNQEAKQLVMEAKNVCIIPSDDNKSESISSALALFYTLKELGKNVNLITEDFPEKLNFLIPSLDFITSPKNFVISIPRSLADVSQIYYEKNEDNLKIHLTVEKGRIKKEHFSFYFSDAKPDLVITLGIQDLQSKLTGHLDAFGFLLDAPILNIDNDHNNKKFGKINVIETKSLAEIILDIITSIDEKLMTQNTANCLLTGLISHYENFKNPKTNPAIFEISSALMKKGALHQQIIEHLYKMTRKEIHFLSHIFQNLHAADHYEGSFAVLDSYEFQDFGEDEANFAVEKMKTMGIQNDMLVLWKSHASEPMIKGFFYSKRPLAVRKIAEHQQILANNDWLFLSMPGSDIALIKDNIIKLLS